MVDSLLDRFVAEVGGADWSRRLDLAREFTQWWHGALEIEGPIPTSPGWPEVLRRFHARFRSAPFMPGAQNEFLCAPHPLEPGRVVFYRENQGVYYWATERDGDDPPVYGAWDLDGPWTVEEPRLSAFLLQALLFETVMGSAVGAAAACVESSVLRELVGNLREVPLGSWLWPRNPTRFYAGGEALLVASPNDGVFSVWAAARRRDVPRLPASDAVEWDAINWDGVSDPGIAPTQS